MYGRHCLCQASQAKEQVFKIIKTIIAFLSHVFLRTNTVMFSKKAVICQRNGSLYLQFRCHHSTRVVSKVNCRVGNLRDSTLLESHVRAQLIKHVISHCSGVCQLSRTVQGDN